MSTRYHSKWNSVAHGFTDFQATASEYTVYIYSMMGRFVRCVEIPEAYSCLHVCFTEYRFPTWESSHSSLLWSINTRKKCQNKQTLFGAEGKGAYDCMRMYEIGAGIEPRSDGKRQRRACTSPPWEPWNTPETVTHEKAKQSYKCAPRNCARARMESTTYNLIVLCHVWEISCKCIGAWCDTTGLTAQELLMLCS